MKKDILISVIVPVYNGDKHIDRAVQSILCQMDGNVELIIVNDGSTDNTGAICDQYARQYSNVRVIHKENGGTSSAKNRGIDISCGEYIVFMDSDDYLDQNCCKELNKVIDAYHPDFIDYGWRYVTNGINMPPALHKLPKNILMERETIQEIVLPPLLNLRSDPEHFIFDFACTRAFRATIVRENHIRFDEDKRTWEDRIFVLRFLKYSQNFYSMDQCFYNYVDTPGSLGRRYCMDFFSIIIDNFWKYRELYETDYDFDTNYVNGYWSRAIEKMIFRSLEETENCAQIKQNILDTLTNEQVVLWFSKRIPANAFERKVGALIVSGEREIALKCYEQRFQREKRRKRLTHIWIRVKAKLKKVLCR